MNLILLEPGEVDASGHARLSGPRAAHLRTVLQATAGRYGRDIMVVETSYPWRAGGWESMATNPTAMTWPVSRTGQARFLRDVAQVVAATQGDRGIGVIWWYPEAIQVPGLFIWGGGSLSLYDATGNLNPAALEFVDGAGAR